MYIISKEIQFDAGHRVPLHASKCHNPHGHRYRVVAHLEGELITSGPESGMVKDFSNVKEALTRLVHDVYDHAFIVYEQDEKLLNTFFVEDPDTGDADPIYGWKIVIVDFIPTAECLARDIFETLKKELSNLRQIDVWETPTSMASYTIPW